MSTTIALFFALAVAVVTFSAPGYSATSSASLPRGLNPELSSLYVTTGDRFTCLDGSGTIPFSRVNDDYCDCNDGSDEPGTAACPNGSFYCKNEGFRAKSLISSRVNDGVCDCCDGSDEWISATCTNECLVLGEQDRLQAIARAKILEEGLAKKRELIAAGREFRRTKTVAIGQIEAELADVTKHHVTAEDEKVTAEAKEKDALDAFKALHAPPAVSENDSPAADEETKKANQKFEELDLNQDGTLRLDEMLSSSAFDYDGNGAVTEDEILLLTSGNSEFTKETFASVGWPSLKDRLQKHSAPVESNHEEEHGTGDDEEDLEDMEDYHPEGDEHAESSTEASKPSDDLQYDELTQATVDAASAARDKYFELDKKKRDLEEQRDTIRKQLDNDYGPEDEYASLQGNCFELDALEYIYKVCPFDTCSQRPKRGGSETQLGKWDKWANEDHSIMQFSNGLVCWNGPSRSAQVRVVCGMENKVTTASEPAKCEYELVFETPAACRPEKAGLHHDEL